MTCAQGAADAAVVLEVQPSARSADEDVRISDIYRLLDSEHYDLLSLDIFDTVVWRMVPTPKDVFFLVANALRDRDAVYSATPESFVRERVLAEELARKKVSSHEVTLEQIYAEFPRGYLKGLAPAAVANVELQIEKTLVKVDPLMRALIEHAHTRGIKTALVSDTYFNRSQIRQLVDIDVAFTILSCEHNVSKYMGLHRFLIDESQVAPNRILHVGDNYEADIEGPEVFGIERYWYRQFPDSYRDIIKTELPETFTERARYVSSHDCGITAVRSRAMFSSETGYERWGAGVLGPIVAGFSDWVVDRCRDLNITSVLCLMREGRVLKQVLDGQEAGLECHEFFSSRFVALKAAIFDGTEAELKAFVFRPEPTTRGRILEQLGIESTTLSKGDPEEMLASAAALQLIRHIVSDQVLKRHVVRSSAEARSHLLRHLSNVLLPGKRQTVAVVDLGYSGTIQRCLHKICQRERKELRLHGLYLVTGGKVHVTQASGAAAEGWLAENGQPTALAHTFMRSPEIAEQSLMADCGTTVGHTSTGEPILDQFSVPNNQRAQIAEIQKGIVHYCRRWAEHCVNYGLTDTQHLRPLYQAICIRSVARPTEEELRLFGNWEHDSNFGSQSTRSLTSVGGLHRWERSHMSAHQLASMSASRLHWPFGFAATISRNMAEAVANIFLRTAKPEVFDSALEPRHLIFYWDSGNGFRSEESTVQTYTMNNRGRVWHRFRLELSQCRNRMCGFTIGLVGEVLQLTGVMLRVDREGRESKIVTLAHDEIEKLGYEHLCDNLYAVREDPALLVVRTEDLGTFTGTVNVDVFFSIVAGVQNA